MKDLSQTLPRDDRRTRSKSIDRRSLLVLALATAAVPCFAAGAGLRDVSLDDEPEVSVEPELVRRIKAISNVFEVGTPEADYGYIEDLGDGRGYTATQYGLCSNELEMARVIELHRQSTPSTKLARYLPFLPPHDTGTDVQKLSGFLEIWEREARAFPSLANACEVIADELYFAPAMRAAAGTGVSSAVGRAIFFDTILQHGGGDDPDSFGAIIERSLRIAGAPTPSAEAQFLGAFLDVRRSVLMNPANAATTEVWRRSVSRVDALATLLERNPELSLPILVESIDVRVALT